MPYSGIDPALINPSGREEYHNKTTDRNFERLGFAAFVIFCVGIAIGLFGVFFKCPYMTDFAFYDFYLQKYI